MLRASTLTGIGLLVASCGDRASRGPTPTIQDSAGINIVTNQRLGPSTPRWIVDSQPLATIGGTDDRETMLSRIMGVIMLADGTIAVSDQADPYVRVYDRSGKVVRRFGGQGHGPGEFNGAPYLLLKRDTIVGADLSLRPIFFSPNFQPVRSISLIQNGLQTVRVKPLGFRPDGALLIAEEIESVQKEDWYRMIIRIKAVPPTGSKPAGPYSGMTDAPEVARVLGEEQRLITIPGDGSKASSAIIFGRKAALCMSKDALVTGPNESFELEMRDLSGVLRRLIRVAAPLEPVSASWKAGHESDARDWIRDFAAQASNGESKGMPSVQEMLDRFEKNRDKIFYAERIAPYRECYSTDEGWIWLSLTTPSKRDSLEIVIFDSAGAVKATTRLPPESIPLRIWADTILVQCMNEDDVPRLEIHHIKKGASLSGRAPGLPAFARALGPPVSVPALGPPVSVPATRHRSAPAIGRL